MKTTSVILAVTGAALAGAATALLLAPHSGRVTRREIRRFIEDHCPKCAAKMDDIADEIAGEIAASTKK